MILKTEYCPFCGKIFYPESTENDKKNLIIHIKEHHHIDEKRYRMIIAALSDSEETNNLCKILIDSNLTSIEFIEKIREMHKKGKK